MAEMLPGSATDHLAARLGAAFRTLRVPLSTEKTTQVEIGRLLERLGVTHEREHRLSQQDVPDFWLPDDGAALEVKMNNARGGEVLRQLHRYARHDIVRCLFLLSNRAIALPACINGKPAYFISLGRAWL